MKNMFAFLKRSKKAFTLMECICALAIVGLLSAVILPLTTSAMRTMRVSDALRTSAATAAANNATQATKSSQVDMDKYDNGVHTMYVTINYKSGSLQGVSAESAFLFTYNKAQNDDLQVKVVYYDLKNGMEEKDAGK